MLHFGPQVVTPPRPPDAPRAVPSKAVSWTTRFFLIFIPPWFGIALVTAIVFTLVGGPIWDDWILDSRSVKTRATAVRVSETSMRDKNKGDYLRIHVRFTDKAGKAHEASYITLDGRQIRAARRHGTFALEYDPKNPERYRFRGKTSSFFGSWVLLPAAIALVLLFPLTLVLRSRSRQRAIYRHGEPTLGRIEKISRTGGSQGRKPVMRAHYVFEGPAGDMVEGKVETLRPPPVGSALWVIYERDNPQRNIAALPLPDLVG